MRAGGYQIFTKLLFRTMRNCHEQHQQFPYGRKFADIGAFPYPQNQAQTVRTLWHIHNQRDNEHNSISRICCPPGTDIITRKSKCDDIPTNACFTIDCQHYLYISVSVSVSIHVPKSNDRTVTTKSSRLSTVKNGDLPSLSESKSAISAIRHVRCYWPY